LRRPNSPNECLERCGENTLSSERDRGAILEQPPNLNQALRTQDVIACGKYRESEFYRDFSKPLGVETALGVCAAYRDSPVCGIAFHRRKDNKPFSVQDRERLTLVAPPSLIESSTTFG